MKTFMVLDYSTSRIIKGLDLGAVLVTARVLMQLPTPSFDIVELNGPHNRFVTHEFEERDGVWEHFPPAQPAQEPMSPHP